MVGKERLNSGLYDSNFEHDACGIGAIANIKGQKHHKIVSDALEILVRLEHRGGMGAEENTGDGAGILVQIPDEFFRRILAQKNIELPKEGDYAVANLFLSKDKSKRELAKREFQQCLEAEGIEFITWREVPTDPNGLGKTALKGMPYFIQAFVKKPEDIQAGIDFERRLYISRRIAEKKISQFEEFKEDIFYVASFSSRTIVYKGMLLATQLRDFYGDLKHDDFKSALALVHSRYSTNTFPSWEKAHPNRYMIHNGEINTLRGNVNWFYTRENTLESKVLGDEIKKVLPIINKEGSDSAILDNTLEFLMMNGKDLPLAVMMAIPEPWSKVKDMDKTKKDFYRYQANLLEPWDGPAAVVFTDGEKLGAVLDRNGLRPARYYVTEDGYLILSSEVGVLPIDQSKVKIKERLRPGKMLLVDTVKGELINDEELKQSYATKHPYGEWLEKNLLTLDELEAQGEDEVVENLVKKQKAFGYTYEDVNGNLIPMGTKGEEPIGAMGIDAPLAVLSEKPQSLYNYFKQLFAQVTNPPIDAMREEIVTATETYLGSEGNLLDEVEENCKQLKLDIPILKNEELRKIKALNRDGFKTVELPMLFDNSEEKGSLEKALEELFTLADAKISEGNNILVLTDRGISKEKAAIPSLLAVAGLHHHLIKQGTRTKVSIVLESGEPREIHHFAALLGFGVSAVNPYLAYETLMDQIAKGKLDVDYDKAVYNFNKAATKGIVKTLSKMGISTIQSYQGAQIFEAIGLNSDFIEKYFTGTASRISGIGIDEIQKETLMKHKVAFKESAFTDSLDSDGSIKFRSGKEEHLYNPLVIHKLQESTKTGDYGLYKEYSQLLNQDEAYNTLRGILEFKFEQNPIPLDEVESVESIVKRFKTGAMSYGSISKEAHEALAIAMNRLGGKSNTGEGGEDRERFLTEGTEENRCSAIKQVASGRFGVTSEYLVNAKEIQIKMAQGAKPGEGGQLPASKVYPWVAKTRHSTTGVGLISPPPHHDIYSIEDLSQLIFDLKNANRNARISVKLVSEAGVGTIAAGVAKGGAEVILISGYDGGTGAAPRTSIKHAGLPWELGLAEANQTLIKNNLRGRVVIETDGKLMTGRDVAIAALLGAEEFGFATAPLVTLGCVMMRVCNLNTCPVGVATQDEELRKRFKGKPEYVVNFMHFVAEELREYMAKLGFRTIDEMVGRVDKLVQKSEVNGWKASKLDVSQLIYKEQVAEGYSNIFNKAEAYDFKLENSVDVVEFLEKAKPALENGEKVEFEVNVTNVNRTLGTILGSEVTKIYKGEALPEDTIKIKCNGSGGQSFGAFIPRGITLEMEGDLNDYVGKGLSGGKIIAYPNAKSTFKYDENVIVGNVALYGATSGEAYFSGIAGERFAVRNSGAKAVVEGVGDHGCEYMTGGMVAIIGTIGKNFAAGMSGGLAYVYDESGSAAKNINTEFITIKELDSEDIVNLKELLNNHYKYTKSQKAQGILNKFDEEAKKFVKIMPKDYEIMLQLIKEKKAEGLSEEEATIAAFNIRTGKVQR